MTTYTGSCHCGAVAYEVDGDLKQVIDCNCSICQRKGALLWFVPRAALRIIKGADHISTYLFNTRRIRHQFCPTCGIHPFGEGTAPNGDAMAAINVRCLDGVDLTTLNIQPYDGRSV